MLGKSAARIRCGSDVQGRMPDSRSQQIAAIEGRNGFPVDGHDIDRMQTHAMQQRAIATGI